MGMNVSEEVITLLLDNKGCMENFKRDKYDGAFHDFYGRHLPFFDALKEEYAAADDKDAYINSVADAFMVSAIKDEEDTPKKYKKVNYYIDRNFQLTLYAFPALFEYNDESATKLAEAMVLRWNKEYPKYTLKPGTFAEINSGFKTKLCYITTAVCESLGKGDDCRELNLLRSYRDEYMLSSKDGAKMVDEYYDIAPTIVNRINKCDNASEIYKNIFDTYLSPCISLIEDNRLEECKDLYEKMTRTLEVRYMMSAKRD